MYTDVHTYSMYDIIFTWYVHTHSNNLNLYLCTVTKYTCLLSL